MRSVVVDLMRESMAARRGGGQMHVTLSTGIADSVAGGDADVVAVDDVLNVLARKDERLVRIVEMKYFAGLSETDIAEALGMSERTLRREWRKARLLLHAALC
jgi:RNA polymerase sigma factor (TIGR02999 family)